MMRILFNSTGTINLRKACTEQLRKCSTITKSKSSNNTEAKLSLKKEDELLNVVNKSNAQELTKYIQQSLAEMIVSNRGDRPYESVNELLSKNEIGSDVLDKFYAQINDHKMQQKKWKNFVITPDVKTITMPKTILGIHVGPTAITWTLINSNCQVLDWDCIIWRNQLSKINTFDLINLIPSIACTLPESSSYVIEELQMTNKRTHHMLSSQQQVAIALSSCIKLIEKQRTDKSLDNLGNSIYVLQALASARFFKLTLGREVLASEYVIKTILNDTERDNKELQDVCIDDELKRKYLTRNSDDREQMGWSLLKALTFARLVIFNANTRYKSSV